MWTGRQAQENGLVDALGGLDRAIALAKQHAKIPADSEVELVIYPPRKSFYELVSEQFSGSGEQMAVGAWLSANFTRGELEAIRTLRGPLATFHHCNLQTVHCGVHNVRHGANALTSSTAWRRSRRRA